jgi:transcriptional regulator with XRE-family HTH domain
MKKISKVTRMKKQRLKLGLSQGNLAKVIGVATSSIGGYERGENPISLKHCEDISRVLETDKSILFAPHKSLKQKFIAR